MASFHEISGFMYRGVCGSKLDACMRCNVSTRSVNDVDNMGLWLPDTSPSITMANRIRCICSNSSCCLRQSCITSQINWILSDLRIPVIFFRNYTWSICSWFFKVWAQETYFFIFLCLYLESYNW